MLRFIICEDNKDFVERVSTIINKVMMPYNFEYKTSKFLKYTDEVEEIIKRPTEQKIYILDIELPEVSGLEIASSIREDDLDSPIIFITSHPEYRDDIFYSRLLAIDYINKAQLWSDRFERTLNYTIKTLNRKRILQYEFNHNSYRIPIDHILYIEKVQENPKCTIYLEDGTNYEIGSNLQDLKEKLGPSFYQTHKSCLVNVEQIKKINYSESTITFKNNEEVYLISTRNKKGLKAYVASY